MYMKPYQKTVTTGNFGNYHNKIRWLKGHFADHLSYQSYFLEGIKHTPCKG